MFAQVLHNSVYTFSIILVTFLIALAGGSLVAHLLIRRGSSSAGLVMLLIGVGGFLVGLSPVLFNLLTDGLSYHAETQGWVAYQLRVFALAGLVMFVPTLLIGSVFPYLLKLSESTLESPGRTIGNLVAINTGAAILGSLFAGFVFLGWLGLWTSIRVMAVLALLGIPLAAGGVGGRVREVPWVPMMIVLLGVGLLDLGNPPLVKIDTVEKEERVLEVWEGSAGVVAVVQDPYGLRIKVDNHYGLGGSASREHERRQGFVPLILHPDPNEVFFLGMGTGITAGAAVNRTVERITVCELVPDAITAARRYFHPFTGGLFGDPRTRILAEDGRTFLRATDERFDVIVADLFIPWKVGVGSLYSLEHFQTARERLKPGGLHAQWIPLFQMSREEFSIVARTMLEVFPLITVWRGDFFAPTPIIALIGHVDDAPLDPQAVVQRLSETPEPEFLIGLGEFESMFLPMFLLGYCGNLTEAEDLVKDARINTDDRPLIEYLAPVTHRRAGANRASWLIRAELVTFFEELRAACPPERDPYLSRLTPQEHGYVDAGFLTHRAKTEKDLGEESTAARTQTELSRLLDSLRTP
jgi:spermidine synthase